eukprot:Skav204354  [mRNA]  locus=scaffold866:27478:30382:+ [translate_table: standard]
MVWKFLFCVHQALGFSECESCQSAKSSQLLQTFATRVAQSSPVFHFDEDKMWGLDKNLSWQVIPQVNDCILRFPASFNSSHGDVLESRFSLGVCLMPWPALDRWRVDFALPASHGRTHPGANPSFVPLPETLKSAFPLGKWFAVSRFGWARCPGMQDFDHRPEAEYLTNLWCSGSYAAVLGSDFSVQAVTKIQMDGADWANAISDVRLWPSEGDLIVSFVPYYFHEIFHALVARLHVDSPEGDLKVWIDRREVRRAESCEHPKVPKQLDCENIQYASTLLRDDDDLLVHQIRDRKSNGEQIRAAAQELREKHLIEETRQVESATGNKWQLRLDLDSFVDYDWIMRVYWDHFM